ncbi:hypothetical protein HS7_19010 [Sulfolobales archaeon HS-7]|nr:hypothetical protein HS7_19010 [Sulfolobales archaeon HS-7]
MVENICSLGLSKWEIKEIINAARTLKNLRQAGAKLPKLQGKRGILKSKEESLLKAIAEISLDELGVKYSTLNEDINYLPVLPSIDLIISLDKDTKLINDKKVIKLADCRLARSVADIIVVIERFGTVPDISIIGENEIIDSLSSFGALLGFNIKAFSHNKLTEEFKEYVEGKFDNTQNWIEFLDDAYHVARGSRVIYIDNLPDYKIPSDLAGYLAEDGIIMSNKPEHATISDSLLSKSVYSEQIANLFSVIQAITIVTIHY